MGKGGAPASRGVKMWKNKCNVYLLPHVGVPLPPLFLNHMLIQYLMVLRPQLNLQLIFRCTVKPTSYPEHTKYPSSQ